MKEYRTAGYLWCSLGKSYTNDDCIEWIGDCIIFFLKKKSKSISLQMNLHFTPLPSFVPSLNCKFYACSRMRHYKCSVVEKIISNQNMGGRTTSSILSLKGKKTPVCKYNICIRGRQAGILHKILKIEEAIWVFQSNPLVNG